MTIRILIVEDDNARVERLQGWIPEGVRLVTARSAGVAIGMLNRDKGSVYQGIMLDYDLQGRAVTDADMAMSGQQVMEAVIKNVDRTVPILVHSMNREHPGRVTDRLRDEGFVVTRLRMSKLSKEAFLEWVEHVSE